MAIQKRHLNDMVVRVYGMLSEGAIDTEIMDELGLTAEDYNEVKITMFDIKADELRKKPTEHVYIDYMIQQTANIRALSEMIQGFRTSNQHNALVGAVRARSEILDKIIKTGQEVGMIAREPEKHEILAGVAVSQLSSKDLKSRITGVVSELDGLVKQFGDGSLQEIEVTEIYSGPKGVPPKPDVEE